VIATGTPARPAFLAGRIRFADMDGSRTTVDVLYGNADDYRWVDLMGGVRPRLLTRVDNGLGALTSPRVRLERRGVPSRSARGRHSSVPPAPARVAIGSRGATSMTPATRASRRLTSQCMHQLGGAPLVVQVVKAVETTDRLDGARSRRDT
jgi:hypothetical protein